MTARQVDERLHRLRTELDDHTRIAEHLGLDLERPLRSLSDGYPENAIALVGRLTEKLLKRLWQHHAIEGDPSGRSLNDLIKRCRPHIRSAPVLDALDDIRRLRNRSTHDGYEIAEEDGLLAVRRLVDVLAWFTSTGSSVLTGDGPRMAPEVARRCEFLAGLYVTLGYRLAKRFVLSSDTVYQLLCRESGIRLEYVELLLSKDSTELRTVLSSDGGELLRTRLPKLTRFVILDGTPESLDDLLGTDYRCVRYDGFLSTLIDLDSHLAPLTSQPNDLYGAELSSSTLVSATALAIDARTGDLHIDEAEDAQTLLERLAGQSANVLLVGRPGSGKSTLLRTLAVERAGQRFRFYFDLSLKPKDEAFPDFAAQRLAPCLRVEKSRVFDLFLYLIRSGSALCVLDAVDEAVDEASPGGFLRLFADLAPVLSAESSVVMSSRVSFLADSPPIRQLLDRGAAHSEQLVEQMYANGVDPDRLPRFHLVRLSAQGPTPLERKLSTSSGTVRREAGPLDVLLGAHVARVLADAGLEELAPRLAAVLGRAFLTRQTVFSVLDLYRLLGAEAFVGGRPDFSAFLLRPLFRPAGDDRLAFTHSAYQELLAARYLATNPGSVTTESSHLTEQVRAFRARIPAPRSDDCVLPTGVYVVGPAERLLLRRVSRPVRFDRHPVTVARYREFLASLRPDGTSEWDHPEQPSTVTHQPWTDRLSDPAYYSDPANDTHPAKCVNWWSAYAFAAFEGKRLPTALEWEAAARGTDGRLFPWGDSADDPPVNCADAWVGRPVITYQAWKTEFAGVAIRRAHATPVDAHPANISPYGIVGMAGNVWEWTATTLQDPGEAVICGGSYDNPLRAVQASSKGVYRKRGGSNAVGFRCVMDVDDVPVEE
ncbi:SUMF1/EgtB/PvdO family nonheme iron enzyme [Streptomyces sp. AN091965]|uniref:SUMF1/EgtB/PvdO family nonheme iron enzyme n=1 Tax=Streptomyces sp. AN091965 TaxID=2927803 RepID=UPI001F60772F|nr:SUMF1/EgtB/PvdO family nonheme iron enzyme [Streptomyces sp. AN091965]MCI3933868.1 SUMF1/EgtB/PvdO family nonheme iron enzyme [Streptomyces sp. AN091965]